MSLHLPHEIWEQILFYIREEDLEFLYPASSFLFKVSLDFRYRSITIPPWFARNDRTLAIKYYNHLSEPYIICRIREVIIGHNISYGFRRGMFRESALFRAVASLPTSIGAKIDSRIKHGRIDLADAYQLLQKLARIERLTIWQPFVSHISQKYTLPNAVVWNRSTLTHLTVNMRDSVQPLDILMEPSMMVHLKGLESLNLSFYWIHGLTSRWVHGQESASVKAHERFPLFWETLSHSLVSLEVSFQRCGANFFCTELFRNMPKLHKLSRLRVTANEDIYNLGTLYDFVDNISENLEYLDIPSSGFSSALTFSTPKPKLRRLRLSARLPHHIPFAIMTIASVCTTALDSLDISDIPLTPHSFGTVINHTGMFALSGIKIRQLNIRLQAASSLDIVALANAFPHLYDAKVLAHQLLSHGNLTENSTIRPSSSVSPAMYGFVREVSQRTLHQWSNLKTFSFRHIGKYPGFDDDVKTAFIAALSPLTEVFVEGMRTPE